ncbi:MAG: methyltransferase domain-containing protein [Pseudomonadota bacterium]
MLRRDPAELAAEAPGDGGDSAPCVLNVGGASKQIALPSHYAGWLHLLLDIAAGPDVDVVLDARKLATLDPMQFDAIYCSHNLEHYYRHDCDTVLRGFRHVLKPAGFVEARVPDMSAVLEAMVSNGMDIDDVLYTSPAGPISVHDVIYGWGAEIERSGVDFYAHKRGFTVKSLTSALERAGFAHTIVSASKGGFEIRALAFKSEPTDEQRKTLGL